MITNGGEYVDGEASLYTDEDNNVVPEPGGVVHRNKLLHDAIFYHGNDSHGNNMEHRTYGNGDDDSDVDDGCNTVLVRNTVARYVLLYTLLHGVIVPKLVAHMHLCGRQIVLLRQLSHK